MPITAGAFVGRDVVVEFSIADENATLASLTWSTLGMMRGKTMSTKWDDTDTTADNSPSYTKTQLVTFKMVEFSGDGVSYADAAYNQNTLRAHSISPGAGTANQPKCWFRMTDPDGKVYTGPFIITSWEDARSHDSAATWKLGAKSNGAVTFA
ncbi:MAG TPA: phage tail tube protein [Burkholderiaceae bacterium]|nr:phage tail tube protein [Burkholderiaceae bacterium]